MQLWIMAAITVIALLAVAYILNTNAAEFAAALQKAIVLASAVLGFAVSVYGGVKAFLGLNAATVTTQEVVAASATSAAGALLLLASRL